MSASTKLLNAGCHFPISEDACTCGYLKSEHADEAIKPGKSTGRTRRKHICEAPTDAFGDISFSRLGQKTGKVRLGNAALCALCVRRLRHCPFVCSQYARVSTDTSPDVLYQLLTDWWKIPPPNLLISVTGGAKNFHLKARFRKMFHRGLIKVAQTTGHSSRLYPGSSPRAVVRRMSSNVRATRSPLKAVMLRRCLDRHRGDPHRRDEARRGSREAEQLHAKADCRNWNSNVGDHS